jgi:peptidoglycan/xylan/chitin deacetylase (PgdA/CDA1 family)
VNLEDIVSTLGSKSSERLAVITFDDGFSDMYVSAYPFLKEKGIRFTLFLITSTLESDSLLWLHKLYILLDKLAEAEKIEFLKDFVGDNCSNDSVSSMLNFIIHQTDKETVNRILTKLTSRVKMTQDQEKEYARQLYLNRTQLLEMAENGLQIHSHGHEHWPMNILSQAELTQEVHQSKEVIEEVFSCNPRFFCFPYGSENKNLTPILQDAAFMGNCCLGNRPVRPDDNPFHLPRVQHFKDAKTFAWQLLKLHLKRKF